MVFLASDRDKVVVSETRLVVPGGVVHRRGPVVHTRMGARDLIEVHGSALLLHLVAVAVAGAAFAVAGATGPHALARVCGVVLVAVTVRLAVVHRRTDRLAARLRHRSGIFALSAPEDRAALERVLALTDRVWDHHRRLPGLVDATTAGRAITGVVTSVLAALRRRRQLREISDELDRSGRGTGLNVRADEEQRLRAAELSAAIDDEIDRHTAVLAAVADAGDALLHARELVRATTGADAAEQDAGPETEAATLVAAHSTLAARYATP